MDNYYVGQKVECIYNGKWYCKKTDKVVIGPKKGEILTVMNIFTAESHEVYDDEYRLQLNFPNYEDSYSAIVFKPLKKVETDISIFTAMLNNIPSELVHD